MPLFHFDTVIDDAVVRDEIGTEYPDEGSAITEARLVVAQMVIEHVRLGKPVGTLSLVVRLGKTSITTVSLQDVATKLLPN
jgi:hypothetical protein